MGITTSGTSKKTSSGLFRLDDGPHHGEKERQVHPDDYSQTHLHMEGQKLTVFPLEDALKRSNLKVLSLEHNQIPGLPTRLATQFSSSLTELSLARNTLSSLPSEFSLCVNLTLLSLSFNPLGQEGFLSLASNVLPHLTCLTNLNLNSCGITSLSISPHYPSSVSFLPSSIRIFGASSNFLNTLPSSGWPSSLQTLYLNSNGLLLLPQDLQLPLSLSTLDLAENRLTSLPPSFTTLTELRTLLLNANRLTAIPEGLETSLTSLSFFNLAYNRITKLTPAQMSWTKPTIELKGNPIQPREEEDYPDQIVDNLFLGCWDCAKDHITLDTLGITHILTVARLRHPNSDIYSSKIIDVDDENHVDLLSRFDECIDFIDKALENGKLLVHCRAGVSRSASVVIAYLMKKRGWTFEESLTFVKSKRSVAPNPGFIKQLEKWEQRLKGEDETPLMKKKSWVDLPPGI